MIPSSRNSGPTRGRAGPDIVTSCEQLTTASVLISFSDDIKPDADDIRAEVAWRMHQWPQVAGLMEKLLGERWKTAAPLSADEEARLLRAGIAYSLAGDDGALDRLRGHFGPFIDKARAPEALRVALAGSAQMAANIGDFSKVAATDDTFAGWVSKMKDRFRAAPEPAPPRGKVASADTAGRG